MHTTGNPSATVIGRRGMNHPRASFGAVVIGTVLATTAFGFGCSSSKKATGSTDTTATSAAAATAGATSTTAGGTTATSASAASTTAAASGGLSGTWSGTYAGDSQGTFTLSWIQAGSKVAGAIKLDQGTTGLSVTGELQGSSIHFGSVGAGAVTYTGTVSGNTMSGTWTSGSANGTWNASKNS
jgi:hypothetical protein